MPGENYMDWSTTAASNANADSSINWAEGQTRASVNDSARSLMAALAKHRNLTNGSISTGGTANAQTFTSGVGYTSVPTGLRVLLHIGAGLTNTGAMTLNMDGIGASAVTTSAGANLLAGMVQGSSYTEFIYNGANWVIQSAATNKQAAKAWCEASIGGAVVASFNISSVTDAGIGIIVFNYTTNISANHVILAEGLAAPAGTAATTITTHPYAIAAGSATFMCVNHNDYGQTDPNNWHFAAFGDYA